MPFRFIDRQWHEVFGNAAEPARQQAFLITPFLRRSILENLLGDSPQEVKVITRFNLDELMRGVSDLNALEYLLDIGAQVKGVKHLHSKVYIFGSSIAIVTSANLTQAALFRNAEFGLVSQDAEFVRGATDYFKETWKSAGSALKPSALARWKRRIAEGVRSGAGALESTGLGDYGTDLGFDKTSEVSQTSPPTGLSPRQWFVKFFGTGSSRAPRSMPVYEEVQGSGSHWALSYPKNRRPRQVKDGDLLFIGRFVKDPPDIMVYGRARGSKYIPGRDDATASDKKVRRWKEDWPRYIRVYQPEFVDGSLGNCVSLYDLMRDLGPDSFVTTRSNALRGLGNSDPKKAYMRQASVRLTAEAAQILDARLEERFGSFGRLTEENLKGLDWPSGTM